MAALQRPPAIAVVLVALAALYFPLTWSDQLASFDGDSAVYVLTARHFAPYLAADPVAAAAAADSQFPPLYPLLLAAAGAPLDLHLAHALTTAFLLGALAVLYGWLRATGVSPGLASAAAALMALVPGTLQQALMLLSETLYLLLSLGCLLALARGESRGGARDYWVATALLAGALLTRSAAVALLPAFALVLGRRRPRGWPLMLGAALAPAALWAVLHRPERSYATGFLYRYADLTPGEVLARLLEQAEAIGMGLVGNLVQTPVLAGGVAVLGALALGVALWRFARGAADAWYVLAYLALIVIWPYPAEALRLAWVILPFLIGYLVLLAIAVSARLSRLSPAVRQALRWSPAGVLALVLLPGVVFTTQRYLAAGHEADPEVRHLPEWYWMDLEVARRMQARDPGRWQEIMTAVAAWQAAFHLELVRTIRELVPLVPEGECVYAIKPSTVAFYGGRRTYIPPLERLDEAAFAQALATHGCRHFLLLATNSPSFVTPFYPRDRLGERLDILVAYTSKRDDSGRILGALARLR